MSETVSPYDAAVGDLIRKTRKGQGLSLERVGPLAHQRGVTMKASILGAYERGERAVSVRRLAELATVFDVPITTFIPGHDELPVMSPEGLRRLKAARDAASTLTGDLNRAIRALEAQL